MQLRGHDYAHGVDFFQEIMIVREVRYSIAFSDFLGDFLFYVTDPDKVKIGSFFQYGIYFGVKGPQMTGAYHSYTKFTHKNTPYVMIWLTIIRTQIIAL